MGIVTKYEDGKHPAEYFNCVCAVCGKKFHDKPSHAAKCKNHYCSRSCHYIGKKSYMSGEGNHQYGLKGDKNPTWKSDKKLSRYGYIQVRVLDHPFRTKHDFVLEHRLVAEKYLLNDDNSLEIKGKRYLKPEYVVHHKNFDRTDNRVENLQVMTESDHVRLHNLLNQHDRDKITGRFLKHDGVRLRSVDEKTIMPKRLSDNAFCLHVNQSGNVIIPPQGISLIHTGVAISLPLGKIGILYSYLLRDKNTIFDPHNIVRIVDSYNYGEITIPIFNETNEDIVIYPKSKIAIMVINDVVDFEIELVEAL